MADIKPVLVVVDVQNGFVTDGSRHVVPVIAEIAWDWISRGRDVVFTRYLNYDGSPFDRIMGWTRFTTSPEIDFVDAIKDLVPQATACVDKNGYYTMFTDVGAELVEKHGWTDLYICGIDTEVCVLKTAVDAFERNITPWLISDASASHAGKETHSAGLIVARKMIGPNQVISREMIQI